MFHKMHRTFKDHSKTVVLISTDCFNFERETSPKSPFPFAVNQLLSCCVHSTVFVEYAKSRCVLIMHAYTKYIITICCFCNPLLWLDSWIVFLWLLARISDSYPSPLTRGDWPPGLDEAVVSWPRVSWPPDHRN